MKSASTEAAPRYIFVDALRGIASLGVLLAHMIVNDVSKKSLQTIVPGWMKQLCSNGQFGVEIFFVLSGFVIALSLSQKPLTAQHAWNFAVRRQLRLDPPYWLALLGFIGLRAAFGRGLPAFSDFALNLIYAHNLVGLPEILPVAWTLCLEIQFYLAFAAILAMDRKLAKPRDVPFSFFAVMLVWATALISCFLVQVSTPWQLYAFGAGNWFYFATGVLSFWCWRGLAPIWTLGTVILGLTVSAAWSLTREASYVSASLQGIEVGLVTALLLFVGGTRGWLQTLSLGGFVQFLGRVSYSLYLTHGFSLESLAWTTRALWGERNGAFGSLILSIPFSLLVAQGFYLTVERPSIRWAARFKK